ncbi:MAG: BrnA antitoxin family protein [Rickettsiales bacterium]|jgi:uncharacterized protein (DUF4415 family)|nr:BrnA antitoxin family protein [Rickettsiales bacterium]
MAIVSYTEREIRKKIGRGEDRSDWKYLRRAMKDDSLIDYSDIPKSTAEDLKKFHRVGRPPKNAADKKQAVSIRLDPDVLAALRKKPNWQTNVNNALRGMMGLL